METPYPRRIRSFVRRPGRITNSQTRAIEEHWPEYGLEYSPERLDLDALFGREAERVLEIGFGNGDTLVAQASADPGRDYIGLEVHEPGVGHCLIRASEAGLTNLRLIAHDAIEVLEHQLADGALSRVNIYFPDPWPKKRHHKRRLIQPTFVELLSRKLRAGGSLCIATDWANYAEHIDEVLASSPLFTLEDSREHAGDDPIDRPMTKFEKRGLGKGHRIRDWHFRRVPTSE